MVRRGGGGYSSLLEKVREWGIMSKNTPKYKLLLTNDEEKCAIFGKYYVCKVKRED